LKGYDGGPGGDSSELEQSLCSFELAVLDPDTLLLEDSEKLLDGPTGAVPVDDAPDRVGIGNVMAGQETPDERPDAGGRSWLDNLNQG
jgi:hypothetical protein